MDQLNDPSGVEKCRPTTISPGQFYSTGSPTVVKAGPFQVTLLIPSIRVQAAEVTIIEMRAHLVHYVILVRKEQYLYYNVVTGRQQPSSMMNVHYHANLSCPRVRCLSFNPAEVEIPEQVGTKLSPEQWLFLIPTFGID